MTVKVLAEQWLAASERARAIEARIAQNPHMCGTTVEVAMDEALCLLERATEDLIRAPVESAEDVLTKLRAGLVAWLGSGCATQAGPAWRIVASALPEAALATVSA